MSQAVQLQTDLAGATLRKDSYLASSHAVWRSHRNIFCPRFHSSDTLADCGRHGRRVTA
jgi:hypothetical protein